MSDLNFRFSNKNSSFVSQNSSFGLWHVKLILVQNIKNEGFHPKLAVFKTLKNIKALGLIKTRVFKSKLEFSNQNSSFHLIMKTWKICAKSKLEVFMEIGSFQNLSKIWTLSPKSKLEFSNQNSSFQLIMKTLREIVLSQNWRFSWKLTVLKSG